MRKITATTSASPGAFSRRRTPAWNSANCSADSSTKSARSSSSVTAMSRHRRTLADPDVAAEHLADVQQHEKPLSDAGETAHEPDVDLRAEIGHRLDLGLGEIHDVRDGIHHHADELPADRH